MAQHQPETRKRRTQSMRSDAMRERLLSATLQVVREDGWARASTLKICRRAGVSRGAQTHHFPAKVDLLLAAVKQVVGTYQDEIDDEVRLKGEHKWSLRRLFDMLWSACLQDGLMECWTEVMVAARTDGELRSAVASMDHVSITAMKKAGRVATPGAERAAADIVELTVYLLRGMVVQRGVHPSEPQRRKLFELWTRMVEDHIRQAVTSHARS